MKRAYQSNQPKSRKLKSNPKPGEPGADTSCVVSQVSQDSQASQDSQVSQVYQDSQDYQDIHVGADAPVSIYPRDKVVRDNHQSVDNPQAVETSLEEKESELFWSGQYAELSLNAFVRLAAEADVAAFREKSQPPGWEFARYCKAHPAFEWFTGNEVFERIDWDYTDFDEEVQENFVRFFDEVKFGADEGPLEWALRRADRFPLRKTKRRLYDRFVSLAGWLQRGLGDEDIFLPQENLAKILGLAGSTISSMTHSAMKDGYLKLIEPAIPHRKAELYRFDIEKFPALKGH